MNTFTSFRPGSAGLSRRAAAWVMAASALSASLSVHAQAAPRVKLATSAGDIVLELDAAKAPKTVDNFLQYVRDKQYDGTVFHRVIDGFMVQGGGFTPAMQEKPTRAPVAFESTGLKNDRGTIAMARTSNPNSATSQFFINVKDNAMLNPPSPDGYGYVVFGKVVGGMDVVDRIRTAATGSKGPHQNVPLQPISITAATLVSP